MNDDPSPGSAAGGGSGSGRSRRTGGSSSRRPSDLRRQRRRDSRRQSLRNSLGRVPAERTSIVMRKARAALTKKLQFFTELMRHLDMLVYAEICTLYYMECSFFRFVLRASTQSFFLSPKPDDFLLVTVAHRTHVVAVFASNALCLLLHLFAALPQASEASRGYLHGGVIVDFIGQKAPSSRYGLVLLDLVVLAVQCLMLAVHTEREKLRKLVVPLRTSGAAAGTAALAAAALAAAAAATAATTGTAGGDNAPRPLGQATTPASAPSAATENAMERGEYRPPPATAEDGAVDWIEMESLASRTAGGGHQQDETRESSASGAGGSDGDGNGDSGSGERDGEAAADRVDGRSRSLDPEAAADSVLDALSSGCNLSDFYVIHAIRAASRDHQGAAAQSLQSLGYAVTLARLAARRGARTATAPQ